MPNNALTCAAVVEGGRYHSVTVFFVSKVLKGKTTEIIDPLNLDWSSFRAAETASLVENRSWQSLNTRMSGEDSTA